MSKQVNFTKEEMNCIEDYLYAVQVDNSEDAHLDIGREMKSHEVSFVVSLMSQEIDNIMDPERLNKMVNEAKVQETDETLFMEVDSLMDELFFHDKLKQGTGGQIGSPKTETDPPIWENYLDALQVIKTLQIRLLISIYTGIGIIIFLLILLTS